MRKLLLLAAVLGLTLFWACRLSPNDVEDHFDIIGDTTWTQCDTVLVELVSGDGKTVDTLFNDVLKDIDQLKSLSAAKYDGSKAALVITGKKGGGLCFEEKRSFQGDGQSVVIDTIKSTSALVQSVVVDPDTLSIPLGGNAVAVKASIKPSYADQGVLWRLSGDGTVSLAVPSGDGGEIKVKPEKIGETVILVRSRKDSSKSAELHVKVLAPSGIEVGLDRDSVVLYVGGGSDSVKATVLPAGSSQKVEWKSLNAGVATIDSTGHIQPVSVGETYVQAKSVANGVYASAHVAVLRDIPKLTVASKTGAPVNSPITFSPKAEQAYGYIAMYKWDLDGDGNWDDSIANPASGLIVDLPPQTAKYTKEGSDTARFYVRDGEGNEATARVVLDIGNQAPEITAIRADADISIKDSLPMTATVRDADGKVAWCGWDYDGDGVYDDSVTTSDSIVNVALGHRYPDAGNFLAILKVKDESGKARLDTVKVKVELDRPVADLGPDFTVTVGASVAIHAKGTDKFGSIAKREIRVQGTGAGFLTLSKEDTTLTAPADPGVMMIVLKVTDDDSLVSVDTLNVTVILSANADLSNLAFSAGALTPTFKPSISFYSAHANYTDSSVTVTPTVKDPSANISVNAKPVASGSPSDPVKLSVGSNLNAFQIVVTAADGTQHVYTVSVARDPSADASLAKLDVTGFTLRPAFAANTVDYADTVASAVASVTLKPTLAVATASLTFNDSAMASGTATAPQPLALGENVFKIAVTSQSGSNKTVYTLKVVRKAQLVLLRSLGGKPATQTDSLEVAPNAPVSITSAPVTGYHFLKWTLLEGTAILSDTAANPANLTVKSAKVRAQAEFVINKYTITAGANAGGSVAPSGIVTLDNGQNQVFTITAATGSRLKSVTVDGADATAAASGGSYTFTNVTANHVLNAVFVKVDTITTKIGAGGTITPTKAVLDEGTDTTFTLVPASGFKLATFKVDGTDASTSLVGNKYTFKAVSANHLIEATFVQGFTLTGVAGAGGSISPTSAGVNAGDNQVFTITANANYRTQGLLDNGNDVFASMVAGKYTLSNISAPHTVVAAFLRQYSIAFDISGTGSGKTSPVSGTAVYDSLATPTYKFETAFGSKIASLLVDGVPVAPATSYSFPPLTANHALSIVFNKVSYPVTAKAYSGMGYISPGAGTISPASVTVDSLGSQLFTFAPAAHYRFFMLQDGNATLTADSNATQYNLTNVVAPHDLKAYFWHKFGLTSAVSSKDQGKVTVPIALIDSNGSETITASPAPGYRVLFVMDNGQVTATNGFTPYSDQSFPLNNISIDHQIAATFIRYYNVAASSNSIDMGTISPASATVDSGSSQDFKIVPQQGFHLVSLLDNGIDVTVAGNTYTLTGISDDHKIAATFAKGTGFTLTIGDSAEGLVKGQSMSHPMVCITLTKSGSKQCQAAPYTVQLESGTDFSFDASSTVDFSDCSGIKCNSTKASFVKWYQVNVDGKATVLDQPNPTNNMTMKANMNVKAFYSNLQ